MLFFEDAVLLNHKYRGDQAMPLRRQDIPNRPQLGVPAPPASEPCGCHLGRTPAPPNYNQFVFPASPNVQHAFNHILCSSLLICYTTVALLELCHSFLVQFLLIKACTSNKKLLFFFFSVINLESVSTPPSSSNKQTFQDSGV